MSVLGYGFVKHRSVKQIVCVIAALSLITDIAFTQKARFEVLFRNAVKPGNNDVIAPRFILCRACHHSDRDELIFMIKKSYDIKDNLRMRDSKFLSDFQFFTAFVTFMLIGKSYCMNTELWQADFFSMLRDHLNVIIH